MLTPEGRRPLTILVVCTGNTCRSPMAEVVLRARLAAAGLGDLVTVSSAGIHHEVDAPMNQRAREALRAEGYTDPGIDGHRARPIDADAIATADLILPMTAGHAHALRQLAERHGLLDTRADIVMYRTFDPDSPRVSGTHGALDVADPIAGGPEEYAACLDQLEAATFGIVEWARVRLGLD